MALSTAMVVAVFVTIAFSLLAGSRSGSERRSLVGFFWGSNALTSNQSTNLFLSSSFSMNGILYQTWLGYEIGIAAIWIQVLWCASYVLLAIYGGRLAPLARTGTLHGVIGHHFGSSAERAASIASIIGFTMLAGWEIVVGVTIFSVVNASNAVLAMIAMALTIVAASYTMLGGLRGNLRANEIQNALKVVTVFAIIGFLYYQRGSSVSISGSSSHLDQGFFSSLWTSHSRLVTSLGIGGFVANAFFSLAWQFVDMSAWQNLAATDQSSPSTIRTTLHKSAVWVFLFPGVFGTIIGVLLSGQSGLTSDNIVSHILQLAIHSWWAPLLFTAGFVAAILSTMDGLFLAAGQAASWDLTKRSEVRELLSFWQSKSVEQRRELLSDYARHTPEWVIRKERSVLAHTRLAIFALAILGTGTLLWLQSRNIPLFNLVYFITIGQMSLVPVVLSCLTGWRLETGNGLLSVVLGLAAGFGFAFGALFTGAESLIGWSPVVAACAAAATLQFMNRARAHGEVQVKGAGQ